VEVGQACGSGYQITTPEEQKPKTQSPAVGDFAVIGNEYLRHRVLLDYTVPHHTRDTICTRVLLDHSSPYLRTRRSELHEYIVI